MHENNIINKILFLCHGSSFTKGEKSWCFQGIQGLRLVSLGQI